MNLKRCQACREACEADGEETPCAGCEWAPPGLDPDNALVWDVYQRVRLARQGDFNNFLDYQVLFHLMGLEGLDSLTQIEIYDKVYLIEADFQRRRQDEREAKERADKEK